MNELPTCPACGTAVERGRAGEMCPACLLRAVMDGDPDEPAADQLPPDPAEIQALFPELEIIGLIGRGGMGVVYQVRQPTLDRFAALKILPRELCARAGFRARFHREARTLAALNHPHIVTIHEFGERDGMFFFLMEFVDGGDLGQLIRAGALAPGQALAIVPQICDALQYAHDAGVVHRDIKPGNILLDRRGRVKVADFGIAKMVGTPGDAGVPSEYVAGTPEYMAPEQLGAHAEVDHRADIYSLGVVFYELLTGKPPSAGVPVLPSQRVQIDVRFDEVVLRAMALDPELRYQQVTEFREGVERVTRPPVRRGWPLAVTAAVVGIVAAGGIGFLVKPRSEPPQAAAEPLPPFVENSLGMRFRPLPGTAVKLSIWETRVRDWRAFAPATGFGNATPDDPVTLADGPRIREFCRWLTRTERAAGRLAADELYRLPTDREWSLAVGLQEPADAKPEDLSGKSPGHYPWGNLAPAPAAAGNFADSTLREQLPSAVVIPAYYDGHPFACAVGSFPPDAAGFFDLGGNVWEATAESDDDDEALRFRGGSWLAGSKDGDWRCLLASFRAPPPKLISHDAGFRVVLAKTGAARELGLLDHARSGGLLKVAELLSKGASLGERDAHHRSALHLAASGDHADVVLALIQAGADVKATDQGGMTPLHCAAAAGGLPTVVALVEAGADVRARTRLPGSEPAHLAAGTNHPEVLEFLAKHGADLRAVDNSGNGLLHLAAAAGAVETITWLAEQHLAIDAPGLLKYTALGMAAQNGDLATCALLLRLGASAEPPVGDLGISPLASAASVALPDLVELLLSRGADPKLPLLGNLATVDLATVQIGQSRRATLAILEKLPLLRLPAKPGERAKVIRLLVHGGMPLEQTDARGMTPLLNAAYFGNAEAVQTLLELGAKPDVTDKEGFTALHSAAEQGFVKVVELLLGKGAPVDLPNGTGRTALDSAVLCGHREVVARLLDAGAKPGGLPAALSSPVHTAAQQGQPGILELLLAHGGKPNELSKAYGMTPLMVAAAGPAKAAAGGKPPTETKSGTYGSPQAYLQCLQILLKQGVDPLTRTHDGTTALHAAALGNQPEAVRLLIEAKIAPDVVDHRMFSPLHRAAQSNALAAARQLLDQGASLAPPLNAYTPLHAAAAAGAREVAALLLERGANPNQRDGKGATPLQWAVGGSDAAMIRLLAEHKADLNCRDFTYSTPLHRAADTDQPAIVEALLDAGADRSLRNIEGLTPLESARFTRREQVIALLSRPLSTPPNPAKP